jgi:hypothetical protein
MGQKVWRSEGIAKARKSQKYCPPPTPEKVIAGRD